jgi:hypothetical protein
MLDTVVILKNKIYFNTILLLEATERALKAALLIIYLKSIR